MSGRRFERYIGIDYSGAKLPISGLKGLRVYDVGTDQGPAEALPEDGPTKYWSRSALTQWLLEQLTDEAPVIVGIDHAFSFPAKYFEEHQIERDWDHFLTRFCENWPMTEPNVRVHTLYLQRRQALAARAGLRRCTEELAGTAKSVFHFGVPGQVAYSTHAGIPQLQKLREALKGRVHFWPFDGWDVPLGRSVVLEVYPRLWSECWERHSRTQDQHDAYSVARMLQEADDGVRLDRWLCGPKCEELRQVGLYEGWILGVEEPESGC